MEEIELIVNKNLEKLLKEGNYILSRESFGGNGGYHNGNPCAGLNFKFDEYTGEITYLGNAPGTNGIFRVELKKVGEEVYQRVFKIIQISIKNGTQYVKIEDANLPERTKSVLEKTVEKYNNYNQYSRLSLSHTFTK